MSLPKKGKKLVKVTDKSTAVARQDYGDDEGAGFESMTREDYAIPFLVVLQALNPQVQKGNAKYIDGAEPGMILNTVTNELWDGEEGVVVVPVHRVHSFIEWVPRDAGGGLVAIHTPESELVIEARRGQRFGKIPREKEGTELVETFSVFGLMARDTGLGEQVLLNFSSSSIKTYKRWMTRAGSIQLKVDNRIVRPPLFAHRYRLTTGTFTNKKGTWHGWVVNWDGIDAGAARLAADSPLYQEAKAFRQIAAVEETGAVTRATKAAEGAGVREPVEEEDDEI